MHCFSPHLCDTHGSPLVTDVQLLLQSVHGVNFVTIVEMPFTAINICNGVLYFVTMYVFTIGFSLSSYFVTLKCFCVHIQIL